MRVALRSIATMALLAATLPALAQVRVSITVAPPPLPVYEQPLCPGEGYLWTPGYWAWDDVAAGYYWVPGTWVLPPQTGLLWTPGYWSWEDTAFVFTGGYWGPVVGFYGGIDYGFGYPGHGYYGGRWNGGRFFYNRSVTNVNVTVVRNTYVEKVETPRAPQRVSYHGGNGGIVARPTAPEAAAAQQRHVQETQVQAQHVQHARAMPELHAAQNNGKPPVLATARPDVRARDSGNNPAPSPQAKERSRPAPQSDRGGGARSARTQDQSAQTGDQPGTRPPRAQGQPGARPPQAEGQPKPRPPQDQGRAAGARPPQPQPQPQGQARGGDERSRDQHDSKTRKKNNRHEGSEDD